MKIIQIKPEHLNMHPKSLKYPRQTCQSKTLPFGRVELKVTYWDSRTCMGDSKSNTAW